MIRTDIRTHSETEEREIMKKLKVTGYQKTHDCMWVMIFEKGDLEIVLIRAY